MAVDEDAPMREFIGWIKIGDGERIPLRVFAVDVDEAYERVVERYGEGHQLSIWNQEDAETYR
jgi:hypothetical protein